MRYEMVRKTLIAGNWKMNGLLEDGVALAKGVGAEFKKTGRRDVEVLVCPPFTLLTSVMLQHATLCRIIATL